MLFDWLDGWHELVVGDRESGCLQEGTGDFDGVSEIVGHPEAQSCERQLDEQCRGRGLSDVGNAARGQNVKPRIAAEQRAGDRGGHFRERRAPSHHYRGGGERYAEPDVEPAQATSQ